MSVPGRHRQLLGWPNAARAVGVVALCTFVSGLMDHHFEPADQIMVYLGGVAFLAVRHGTGPAALAVVLGILTFDLIFVPPRWGFNPTNPQYFFTFGVMLVVGLLISRLAAKARLEALVAEARARRARALTDLARQLVSARAADAIAGSLTQAVHATFGVASTLLLPDEAGALADPSGGCSAADLAAAQRLFATGRGDPGAAGDPLLLPLRGDAAVLGVLAVRALPPGRDEPEDRELLHAFCNQTALALERAHSERRRADAALAAEAERLRSTLLSGISHDLRTPLTTIVGAATSLVQQGAALDDGRRALLLRGILDEAQRMHASMSDLLDLTRMEEGAVQPQCEWCPADELVEEARSALGARLAGRAVQVEVPADAVVWCDARLVEQALVNLLDNALRHTPVDSRISVAIAVDAAHWRLVVADNGPGLPAGREQEVFRKFARGRDEPAGAGTGLGLAICAAVARLHGGTIAAANDGGARFTLTLPQAASGVPAFEEAA